MKKEIVFPDYNHCILNTITSILKYYNVETNHNSLNILDDELKKHKYKNIIFMILDGLGEKILKDISPNGFLASNQIDCLLSVYPSTTTAALTTYYSGKPPYETGWIAWSQYFKEYGRALDMLSHNESYLREPVKGARIDVFKEVVNYETVFSRIESENKNIKAYEIMPEYSDRRAKRSIIADNIEEIIENIQLLINTDDEKFIMTYLDKPDKLLHKYGTKSEEVRNFILDIEKQIKKLSESLTEDTLLIISADHGHKDIEESYTLLDYPEIQECLIMPPSLESRVVSFWVKEEMREEFQKRFENIFKDEFLLIKKEEFLEKKFLGDGIKHYKIDDFIGNYIALSTGGSIIRLETFLAEGKPVKKSTHCGLTKDEMEVPLIVIKKK